MSEVADKAPGDISVSVVMTTYNGAAFVEEAVRSILDQTHRSLELVIVDDGSTDETSDIAETLATSDSRVCFEAAIHSGIASSRNRALARARGQFITFLDQDDLCPPDRIARQHARLVAEASLAAVFGKTIMFEAGDQGGDLLAKKPPCQTMLISAALFRHEVFREIGIFNTAYAIADDFDFVLRLIESGQDILVEDGIGVFYRQHAGQQTANRAATRSECARVLQQSLRRRRKMGIGPLEHPLINTGSWLDRR